MRSAFRLLGLAVAFAAAMVTACVSHAEDNDIVPIRDNPELLKYYRMLAVVDRLHPPLSYLDSPHPIKMIVANVEWPWPPSGYLTMDDLIGLREFALRVTRARLEELGVAGEITVVEPPPFEQTQGRPPQGLSECDVFHVTFRLGGAPRTSALPEQGAVAVMLLAYQPASIEQQYPARSCLYELGRPSWVLQSGPRLFMADLSQKGELLGQARAQILEFIDHDLIVGAIIRSSQTAHDRFNEIVLGRK